MTLQTSHSEDDRDVTQACLSANGGRPFIKDRLYRHVDVDEHIHNLTFFDKLVLCRGLKFSIPETRISVMDIQTFEKVFWKLKPKLSDDKKELAVATLRSIALNYIERKSPQPPKSLIRSIKGDDIVITEPGLGRCRYGHVGVHSTPERGIYRPVSLQKPTTRGRPPRYYHPLLAKEKHLESVVRRILPKEMTDELSEGISPGPLIWPSQNA